MTTSTVEKVRQRAFEIWEAEGRPEGRDVEHWTRAEAEVNGGHAPAAAEAPPAKKPRAARTPKTAEAAAAKTAKPAVAKAPAAKAPAAKRAKAPAKA
jgi:hypothetical protein